MLLKQWPALMHFYGVKPWEIEQFTRLELNEMIAQLPRREEET